MLVRAEIQNLPTIAAIFKLKQATKATETRQRDFGQPITCSCDEQTDNYQNEVATTHEATVSQIRGCEGPTETSAVR